jgi:hypothetical protein
MCERRYLVGEQWYNLRPDAALGVSCGAAAVAVLVGVGLRPALTNAFCTCAFSVARWTMLLIP